jgi:hypothetical protein
MNRICGYQFSYFSQATFDLSRYCSMMIISYLIFGKRRFIPVLLGIIEIEESPFQVMFSVQFGDTMKASQPQC